MSRTSRWAVAAMAGAALGGTALPTAATAAGSRPGDAALHQELRRIVRPAGSRVSVVVRDTRGRRVADVRGGRMRPLGSTTKLFTAAAALQRRLVLTTDVLAAGPIASGVLDGDLVLRGGGDPSLGTAAFAQAHGTAAGTNGAALADRLVALGLREVRGSVLGDASRFDAALGGPTTGGGPDVEFDGVLGGLTWNRGRAGDAGVVLTDPARGAAAAFDDLLEARGVVVRGVPRAGATPPGASPVAAVNADMPGIVTPMLKVSDDLYADALAKALAAGPGVPGTTAAGAAAVAAAVRPLRVRPRLVDGSGLSARSRGTARDLVTLLLRARKASWGSTLRRSLPVAGTDGTLQNRLRSVRGRCEAKTGNLETALSALAGQCRSRAGRTLVFAVLVEGQPLARGNAMVDRVAAALVRKRS
jgi:D-alanyl-D-alanine carboxypeptidase/D-alanyl-D-alanine-endopeptidase (penicillin-binding protein 4)